MARRPRQPTEAERHLWERIAAHATPLHPARPRGGGRDSGTAAPAEARLRPGPPTAPNPALDPDLRQSTGPKPPIRNAKTPDWPPSGFHIGMAATARPQKSGQQTGQKTGLAHGAEPGLPRAGMDRRQHRRLRKGKLTPEARIDLHGMTLATAHQALIGFVLQARAANKKLILVITGKGRGGVDAPGPLPATRRGALRHDVPRWLEMPPLDQIVSGISQAHDRHGGGGAYYVWLRRNRG